VFRRAATELDNAGLRALLAVQLVEVQQSRARLAAGQHEERRRIERNLHDGAQQRLLALALQLQAASVNGSEARLREAVVSAVAEARQAVAELRDLANGLRPAVLTDGGLQGAFAELAERAGFAVTVDAELGPLAPDLEETAWFIVCEAVANAQKHGDARAVGISAHLRNGVLAVAVSDDGCGGADPDGRGLRGLRDRAEAIGGTLVVRSPRSGGTVIEAALPCAS
jgi:signal transduction histidine kinase